MVIYVCVRCIDCASFYDGHICVFYGYRLCLILRWSYMCVLGVYIVPHSTMDIYVCFMGIDIASFYDGHICVC
jgi:hypothetical protein